MTLTHLFKRLGAPLANQRWSWGADREDGAVFLRVWQDQKKSIDGRWHLQITHHEKYSDAKENLGYQERLRHLEMLKGGAKCYMVMCLAKDKNAAPRWIASFKEREVSVSGKLAGAEGDW